MIKDELAIYVRWLKPKSEDNPILRTNCIYVLSNLLHIPSNSNTKTIRTKQLYY